MTAKGYTLVLNRAGSWCERCGKHPGEQMHHRQARGMGGSKLRNGAHNLLYLCRPCHEQVEAHPAEAYEHGWKVRMGQDPADTPVWYRQMAWVTLTPQGMLEGH